MQQTGWEKQALVETRRGEAMALFETARGYNARNDQLVALGVSLIAVTAGLGLKENLEELFLGVPVALLLLLVYALQLDNDIRAMSLARGRIEDVLEEDLGGPALIYESHVAQYRQEDYIRSIEAIQVIVFIFALGTSGVGGVVAWRVGEWLILTPYALLLFALWECLVRALHEQTLVESDARKGLAGWAKTPDEAQGGRPLA